jgi:predicted nucleotidyltransferase component of viral defense system
MKEILNNLLQEQPNDFMRRSTAREYLQARILLSLQDHGAFENWSFVGGTALRFLYQLPRYSEDLDFSLLSPGQDPRFEKLMTKLRADLAAETYSVDIKISTVSNVASAFVRFRGLPHELGISPHEHEVLSVKVEIDTNPPTGAVTETRILRRFVTLNLLHHDRSSLFAGKLHAVLSRSYTKGRDLYDLAWYLSDPQWPRPNLELLNNALAQTAWTGPEITADNWKALLLKQLHRIDWKRAVTDVSPFLARKQDIGMVSHDTIARLLKG